MNKILENIKDLVSSLPEKDVEIARSFIEKRDFESLKELVSSAIIKIQRNLRGDSPREDYLSLDLEKMTSLESEVSLYLDLIWVDTGCPPVDELGKDLYEEYS